MNLLQILADQKEEILNINTKNLVGRPEEKELNLDSKFAQVVIGVRRCGKSTLCQKVLVEKGINFGYVNFDDERLAGVNPEQMDEILSCLYRLNGDFNTLFLDEIQNIKFWPLFVNRMLRQGMRIVLTGSNANLLSSELITHLTGRYNKIELYPFSFSEVCKALEIKTDGFTTKNEALLKRALDEYLIKGGFPEIVEGSAPSRYAFNLLSTIVKKDVVKRYRVKYPEALWRMSNVMLERPGAQISSTALSEKLGIKSYHTVDKYIDYLVNAYLILKVKKFSTKAMERKLYSKGYAIDPAFISDHEDKFQSEGYGWRLENVVALEIMRRLKWEGTGELYFCQSARMFYIDFVVCNRNNIKELIQVCYNFESPDVKLYNREVGNLFKAGQSYKCHNLTLIIMEGEAKVITRGDFEVKVVKAVDWLLHKI